MKIGILHISFLLSFINCTSLSNKEIRKIPKKDKSTSINIYIKTDSMYKRLFTSDFLVTEILSKDISEGFIVNARVKFKKIKTLTNEQNDTSIWINNIIMSSENDILRWGKHGIREELFIKSKEKTYHIPIKINN